MRRPLHDGSRGQYRVLRGRKGRRPRRRGGAPVHDPRGVHLLGAGAGKDRAAAGVEQRVVLKRDDAAVTASSANPPPAKDGAAQLRARAAARRGIWPLVPGRGASGGGVPAPPAWIARVKSEATMRRRILQPVNKAAPTYLPRSRRAQWCRQIDRAERMTANVDGIRKTALPSSPRPRGPGIS